MRRIILTLFGLLAGLAASGCVPGQKPPRSQLQVREFETREYDVRDPKRVMKALVDVLQDDGFIVKNAVVELGLLTASKQVDVTDRSDAFFRALFMGSEATWEQNREVEVSVNVTPLRDGNRVRANFQSKVLSNHGTVISTERIEDPMFYQDFFSKVDKGLFLEDERL